MLRHGRGKSALVLLIGGAITLLLSCNLYPTVRGVAIAALALWGLVLVARVVRETRSTARELNIYVAELRKDCPGSGYDMHATPQRCPEYGREPERVDTSPPPGFFDSQPPGRRER